MKILEVLFWGTFLNEGGRLGTMSRERCPVTSSTILLSSFQEPKSPLSDSINQKQTVMKSLIPFLSALFGTFGMARNANAEQGGIRRRKIEDTSLISPANFTFSELREVIEEGKVYVINDFINRETINGLRDDINRLVAAKMFAPSGLSNRAKGR